MQVLEERVPFGALQLVDGFDGALGVVRAIARPGGEQRGGKVGDRAAHRLRKILLGKRILLLLERTHAERPAARCGRCGPASAPARPVAPLRPRRLPRAPRGTRAARARCSSDRCAAPRGNRRRRHPRRAARRRDGPRDSCRTRRGAPIHPPTARMKPAAASRSRRIPSTGALSIAMPSATPARRRNWVETITVRASMGGAAPALRVGRRMAFLQSARKDGMPSRRAANHANRGVAAS